MDNFSLVTLLLSILIGIIVSITIFISFISDKTKSYQHDDPEETLEKLRLD
jgi:Tfp pilus assembly protein PilW